MPFDLFRIFRRGKKVNEIVEEEQQEVSENVAQQQPSQQGSSTVTLQQSQQKKPTRESYAGPVYAYAAPTREEVAPVHFTRSLSFNDARRTRDDAREPHHRHAHPHKDDRVKESRTQKVKDEEVVALHDFEARTQEDLTIRRHEHLQVLNKMTDDWWLARSKVTGLEGYIPSNFVAYISSIEAEPWYFGEIKRGEVQRMLMDPANQQGAFLVRMSESRKNEYALSVKDKDAVMHYHIRTRDHEGCWIARSKKFRSIQDLIAFYQENQAGLCTKLREPCVKLSRPDTGGLSWDIWEIPKEQIILVRCLGSGQFGEVYEGRWNKTVKVAVKTLKPGKMNPDDFLAEAQVLKGLRHEKLLQLYAVSTREQPYYIITELVSNGSLLDYLRGPRGRLPLTDQVFVASQVASGMEYLEQKNFIHRDLAARNVLVGENNIVKVADFGLSRLVQEDVYQAHEGARFPIKWTAPEALTHNCFTTKSDVWSFGVLLMEVITYGAVPYPGLTNQDVVRMVDEGYRMPQPRNCPDNLYKMMLVCWARDPVNRPTFEDLHWQLDGFFALQDEGDYNDPNME